MALHISWVLLGIVGTVLVWLPVSRRWFSDRALFVLRLASFFPGLVTCLHVFLFAVARFAVPVYPEMFLLSMVVPVVLMKEVGERLQARSSN